MLNTVPAPVPGTIIDAYRVEGVIGSGSMGEVYRAIDIGLHRKVAIKLLSEKHRDNPELRARFVREGRAVAAVSHPAVVQVFATGVFDERPYIAMEFLDGVDLGSLIENNGPLNSVDAAAAALDAATGLEAAAKAGLIHRDVKPSNLVRLGDGRVKVTDFGLAKPLDPGNEPALTALGVVVGTPDYIAPEQARGDAIDERVDIYALGGTLYFMLTGIPPFRTGKPGEDKYLKVVARHLRNPAPDARTARSSVDAELSALTRQMMEKSPSDRPNYTALTAALNNILTRLDPNAAPRVAVRDRSRPFTLPPPEAYADESSESQLQPSESIMAEASGQRRGLPLWAWLITAVCVGIFIAGIVLYASRKPAPTMPGPSPNPNGSAATLPAPPVAPPTPYVVPAPVPPNGNPAAIVAPPGMILVRHPDGAAWLFVAERPVTVTALQQAFPHLGKRAKGGATDDSNVVQVPYTAARTFATSTKKRLLSDAEWDAATSTPGFITAVGFFEWVESPTKMKLARKPGATAQRADRGFDDVTFRLAQDLPAPSSP